MQEKASLLNQTSIKQLPLNNKTVVAPMSRVSTKGDGIPTIQMARYYQRYAKGGFALTITEGAYTDRTFSQAYPNQPGITNNQQQEGWKKIVDATHEAGGKIILQLMHAGALSQHLSNTRSASVIQPIRQMLTGYSKKQGKFPLPQAMNLAEIEEATQGFVDSAIRAQTAGFDGIEIHAANGYLLDQFLTHYTNNREDQYGQSVENRCRLICEITTRIKASVSSEFIVGVRLSQGKVNDFEYKWPNGINDGEVIFTAVARSGADYIHFASEGKGFNHSCLTPQGESLPQLAKKNTTLPVIANGGLDNIEEAHRILNNKHADLIALGTGALANPDWPTRIQKNQQTLPFNTDMFAYGVTIDAQLNWEKNQKK